MNEIIFLRTNLEIRALGAVRVVYMHCLRDT